METIITFFIINNAVLMLLLYFCSNVKVRSIIFQWPLHRKVSLRVQGWIFYGCNADNNKLAGLLRDGVRTARSGRLVRCI